MIKESWRRLPVSAKEEPAQILGAVKKRTGLLCATLATVAALTLGSARSTPALHLGLAAGAFKDTPAFVVLHLRTDSYRYDVAAWRAGSLDTFHGVRFVVERRSFQWVARTWVVDLVEDVVVPSDDALSFDEQALTMGVHASLPLAGVLSFTIVGPSGGPVACISVFAGSPSSTNRSDGTLAGTIAGESVSWGDGCPRSWGAVDVGVFSFRPTSST